MPNNPSPHRHPRRQFSLRRAVFLAPIALTCTLTGCEQSRYGMPNPATKQGDDVLQLWQVSFYAAVALGALVLGVLFYSIVRHRRRNDDLPKQTEGNVALEVTYTVIPFILVGLLFAYGLKVQAVETKLVKHPDLTVNVTGYQWNWRFSYPVENVTVVGGPEAVPVMVLPINERVRFNLVAADVAHSFFVPDFVTKRDLIPGVHNEIEVTPKRTGVFIGHCAEFCGLNHSQMNFQVRIVSQPDYATWVGQQQQLQNQQQSQVAS